MATEIKLPSLGEGVESGDVLEILVKPGDSVKQGEGLLELETDKATVTVPAPSAGTITAVSVKPGETVAVGAVIAMMEGSGGGKPAAAPAQAPAAKAPAAAQPAAQQPPPAPKAAAPAPAAPAPQPVAPKPVAPKPVAVQPVAAAPVAAPDAAAASQQGAGQLEAPEAVAPSAEVIAAGPAIRRFAREVGVDLATVSGTGEGGRITREDVLRAVRDANSQRAAGGQMTVAASAPNTAAGSLSSKPANQPGAQGQDEYGPVRIEKMSKIRKTIASQMHKSWSTVPRVTNFDDADVTDLEIFRAASKDDYASQGIKLTTMPFLIKAVATALRHHPAVNAVIDSDNDQIIYKDYVNIGIAVDTERGLVVPNIRHVDDMSIPEIAKALAELAARVRGGEFGVNELRGGTFTISNLGAIGGTYSTPIVNVPEVAILLVGRTRKLPVVMEDDSIKPRLMMPLSLSYDHRLVDGGTAARFLNDVIAYLEAPSRLLLAIT
jgi:pyruvate dehydrogenase E2 component (dihydrolipoamide acetyltransferase)